MSENENLGLVKKGINVGIINVSPGEIFEDVAINAAKLALDQGLDAVGFIFNGLSIKVEYYEARQICSPQNLWKEIEFLEHVLAASANEADKKIVEVKIEQNKTLGTKVYGEDFLMATSK